MTTPTTTISASDILNELQEPGTFSIDANDVRKLQSMAPTHSASGQQISFADLHSKSRWLDYGTLEANYCSGQQLVHAYSDGDYGVYTTADSPTDGVCGYSSLIEGTTSGSCGEGGSVTLYAPAGTTFKYLIDGVYGYNCGGVNFTGTNVAGATVLTFYANNGTYGDPCGGTYKYLRVTAYYNNR